ncbi:alpha/beta hydrolase family protein [Rhizomonospora bruguierae]|uniref:alpha/beta hydrolase family protein n=1 Tax=Rhizomonospora bruguierae TaxID=1581705 RepID=UPI001BCC42F2|nr:chlorophyllase [Micromonospora sp. NBRC 107566]
MRRLALAGPLAAALLAGLVACGDEPPVSTTTAPPTAPSAAAPTLRPITGTAPSHAFDVAQRKLLVQRDGRSIPVTVWYPQGPGPFPVVLFSHGLGTSPVDYRPLLMRWARAGFTIAAPTYPQTSSGSRQMNVLDVLNQPADASATLDQVLALNRKAGDPLRGRLATDRVAAAGHSAGGITTVGLFTVARDDRLRAGVVLAGSSLGMGLTYAGAPAPMLFVHGQRDTVVKYADGKAAFDAVPWPKAMLTLPAAGHGEALLSSEDGAFTAVADTTLDFLRWSLYGDAAAKRRMTQDAGSGSVARLDSRL